MRYYNVLSNLFKQEITTPPGVSQVGIVRVIILGSLRIKIGSELMPMLLEDDLQSTTIAYILRDTDARVLTTYSKKLGNCPILIAECEAVRCAILAAISMGYSKVYINTDSQTVVNAIKGRIPVPKDIINLVEDIRWLYLYFMNIVLLL